MALIGEAHRKWWLLAAMGSVLGVILLDETVVGVALPSIQADLGMSEVASHWVVNVYMLVLATFAAAAGKLGDIVGHKVLMIAGLAIFGLASLACGIAENGIWLIAARGVQGLGAAIIFPVSLTMVTISFPENQTGMALGVYASFGTGFLAIGPLVGGFLTGFLSWHWIFLINPPVVFAIALVVVATWREPQMVKPAERIDKPGFLALVGGLSMLVFAIMQAPDWGWASPSIVILLFSSVALLLAFVSIELKRPSPLIEVGLFANPTFAGCNLVIFAGQFFKMSVIVFAPLYFQKTIGMSPFIAGLALLPAVVTQPFTAFFAGTVADRFGARLPSLACVLVMLAGLAWIAVAIPWQDYTLIFFGLLATGLARVFFFVPPERALADAVPPAKRGQAGGIAKSSQLLGATIGMAVSSTVYNMTDDFQAVFAVNAALALVVLTVAWLTIEQNGSKPVAPLHRKES